MAASVALAMGRAPAISILMAVFNAPEEYLDAAIDSILQQSWWDFELIIVDDGSDNITGNRLRMWADRDRRIRLHKFPTNVGLTKSLNAGLKLARGAFLARHDADDISGPQRLEAQIEFLSLHPEVDAVGTDAVLIDVDGNRVGDLKVDPGLKGLSRRNLLVHGSMLFRRHVFDSLGGYDERMRLSQDYELYLRMLRLHGMQIGVLSEAHYSLRQHPGSLSSRRMFRQLYYSVMAKSLTERSNCRLGNKIFFYRKLFFDYFFTHRIFLGHLFRNLIMVWKRAREKGLFDMKAKFHKTSACRICGNTNLINVVDLGEQYLTGVFPRIREGSQLTKGPLQLVKCQGDRDSSCGLVQLRHTYSSSEMYGDNYGYRSGLNNSMVDHLQGKIISILARVSLASGDLVIDIGSNDGTSLAAYPEYLTRVGVDPVGVKFRKYYPPGVTLIPALFSADLVAKQFPAQKAKVITSFSMMYDLEDPQSFVREVASLLDSESGLWVFEQSYLPLMLERVSFDTICHEHIEYYGLRQIEWLLGRAGLRIVDVEFNDINGGSFSVVAAHRGSCHPESSGVVNETLRHEEANGLDGLDVYVKFSAAIAGISNDLKQFLATAKAEGKRVCAIGASTKGNVLLQYCGLTANDIEVVGEINPEKFGALTPGSWIPIEDEARVLASKPDYLLVLPWHFRENFLSNPSYKGHRLVFPLPRLEIVSV